MAIVTQAFSKKGRAMLQKLFLVAMMAIFVGCSSQTTSHKPNAYYGYEKASDDGDLFYINLLRDILINIADTKPNFSGRGH